MGERQPHIHDRKPKNVASTLTLDQPLLKKDGQRRHQKVQGIGAQLERDANDVVVQRHKQQRTDPASFARYDAPADMAKRNHRNACQHEIHELETDHQRIPTMSPPHPRFCSA